MIPSDTLYQYPYHVMTQRYNKVYMEPAKLLPEYNQKPLPVIRVKPQIDGEAIAAPRYTESTVPLFEVYGVK